LIIPGNCGDEVHGELRNMGDPKHVLYRSMNKEIKLYF